MEWMERWNGTVETSCLLCVEHGLKLLWKLSLQELTTNNQQTRKYIRYFELMTNLIKGSHPFSLHQRIIRSKLKSTAIPQSTSPKSSTYDPKIKYTRKSYRKVARV
jgi:hypothetical protein